jgi:EAL domain-containing protein (putative c-di-GMP-specific phosphodiesterase class I)
MESEGGIMFYSGDAGGRFQRAAFRAERAQDSVIPGVLEPYLEGIVHGKERANLRWQNHDLYSVFQPIVSFSHSRIIAHEALLRATSPSGVAISPLDLFDNISDSEELIRLDRSSRLMHILNAAQSPGWFFLNLHPALFGSMLESDSVEVSRAITKYANVSASQFVIEIVEEDITDHVRFEEGVGLLREIGMGLALDDFGAGHSNFDRVWKIRPDVVKLDRTFSVRASEDRSMRRLLPQIVSILHEAGTLVLLEGIETLDQARIAMDSNVDFGQGWYFAKPALQPVSDFLSIKPKMDDVWDQQSKRANIAWDTRHRVMAPYLEGIWLTAQRAALGESLEEASSSYLQLPHVACLYMLDETGLQVGRNLHAPQGGARRVKLGLGHMEGARWSRRAYFIRAMHQPGKVQTTRPYLSVATGNICVTVSIQVEVNGRPIVICGDVDWEELEATTEE